MHSHTWSQIFVSSQGRLHGEGPSHRLPIPRQLQRRSQSLPCSARGGACTKIRLFPGTAATNPDIDEGPMFAAVPVIYEASCKARNATAAATIFRSSKRLHRDLGRNFLGESVDLLLWQASPSEDRGFDRARRNGVHADAPPNKFHRRSSRHRPQRSFGCRICARSGGSLLIHHARIKDNRRSII